MKKFFKMLAVALLVLGLWSFADGGSSATVVWLLISALVSYVLSFQKLVN